LLVTDPEIPRPDVLTVASIAVVVYAIANVAHEGLGHGGACLMVGCTPHLLTSMQFDGDAAALPALARRFISAGGSLMNLVVATLAMLALRRARAGPATTWFFLWLLATLSLLQATGYLLFSGLGNFGDWAAVVRGLPGGSVLWRGILTVAGGATYWWATSWAMVTLGARLRSSGPARAAEAYRYTLVAYFAGAGLYLAAGSRDPAGTAVLLISGVAASLGGAAGLAWGPQLLKNATVAPTGTLLPPLQRDWRWVAAAAVGGGVFVFVLGSGIRM
jgi:hypothetical protein